MCSPRLRDLAAAARARTQAKVIGVTGSVGKTGTKEALRLALSQGWRDPRLGRLLQQSLGRAAVARALPGERALRGAGNGHEPRRRDRAAVAARPSACRDHHHDRAGASRILRFARQDRRRQGRDLSRPRSRRRRRPQPRQCAIRAAQAPRQEAGVARIVSFGEHEKADARLRQMRAASDCSTVEAQILGTELTYKIGAPGRHLVRNSLAVLATVVLVGADLALAALALAEFKAGVRPRRADRNRSARRPGIRASTRATTPIRRRSRRRSRCSAKPQSGRAAGASPSSATCSNSGRAAVRCIAASLAPVVGQRDRSRVLLRAADARAVAGSSRRPPRRLCRGLRRARGASAVRDPCRRCRHGQGFARLAHGAHRQGAAATARSRARRGSAKPRRYKVEAMLYWLVELSDKLSVLNVFRYITFRTGGAVITALVFVFLFGPLDHRPAAAPAGQGPADPHRRPEVAHHRQGRHADDGRADDPVRHAGVDAAVGQSGQSLCLGGALGDARLRPGRLLRRLSESHKADARRIYRPHAPAASKR